jgi:hypothetical protein
MRLVWNGKDITGDVEIAECVHKDVAGGRADSLEMTFYASEKWQRWQPEEDDVIEVTEGAFTTGKMYLSAVTPYGNKFRLIATSLPGAAIRKSWKSYRPMSIAELFEMCAAEAQMKSGLYGIDGKTAMPYMLRQEEGPIAFLSRIGEWEDIKVKAYNGTVRGIYMPWAAQMDPVVEMTLKGNEEGIYWRRRGKDLCSAVTVINKNVKATATGGGASGNEISLCLPAANNIQAGRWAKGILACHNRKAEEIEMDTLFGTGIKALSRVDITGPTGMSGEWMAEEVESDLVKKRANIKMLRAES